jgi:mRNA interferase MazF
MADMTQPQRGEVWQADLSPTLGHEQSGKRPVLVVSTDRFNTGPAGLVVIVPVTSKGKGIPWHVPIEAPEGGLRTTSFAMCEAVRSVTKERLTKRLGQAGFLTMDAVDDRLRILLDL